MCSPTSRASQPPEADADFVQATLAGAASRAELRLSVVRLLFCALILLRFVWIHVSRDVPGALERGLVVVPVTACGMLVSLGLLHRVRRREVLELRLLFASVALDVLLCTAAPASNVLWPWPE